MEDTLNRPRLEDLPPKDRGQWLLSEAQSRLIVEIQGIQAREKELLKDERSSEGILNWYENALKHINESPNVIYQKRGNRERLKGEAAGYGKIDLERQYGSSDYSMEWELFGSFARKRCEIAAEVAREIGFDVLGHGIPPKPAWNDGYTDSYDLPPRLETPPHEYETRAAKEIQDKLDVDIEEAKKHDDYEKVQYFSEKYDAINKSLGLRYNLSFGMLELKGRLEGKSVEVNVNNPFMGNRYYSGEWGEKVMEEQEAEAIWSKYADVVDKRQLHASNIWENEKYILQQLGVA